MSKAIERAYKVAGEKGFKKFSKAALYIANKYCEFPNGGKDTIVWCNAVDMAMGAELVKKKYVITGVAIGVLGTYGFKRVQKLVKKTRA